MDENGISEQSYYHWQRRFRRQAYEEMKENTSVPAVAEKAELTFVEIPCVAQAEINTHTVSNKPVATIRTAAFQIDISFYFAENVLIDAKASYGWAQDFCFFINDSKQGGYPGQEIYKRLQILRKNNTSIS